MSDIVSYSDPELVAQLKSEDQATAAFTELYNRYWKRLLTQALYKLGSEEAAEEVLQDVFMNLWRRRQTLQIRHSFHTYIASSVKYEILSRLSKQKAKIEFEQRAQKLYAVRSNDTEQQLDYELTRQQLEETVKTLPEKCQLVYRLSREAGMSEKQIAEELKIAPKTVEAHITKALKTIRGSLQSLFEFFF